MRRMGFFRVRRMRVVSQGGRTFREKGKVE